MPLVPLRKGILSSDEPPEIAISRSRETSRKITPTPDKDKVKRLAMLFEALPTIPNLSRKKLYRAHEAMKASGNGTWGHRTKSRASLVETPSNAGSCKSLPRNYSAAIDQMSADSTNEELPPLMSLAYAKFLKLKKQREELMRIYNMLDELENAFLGSKDNPSFIEREMEVKVKKDYMLSAGNPESTLEQEDTVRVLGYLGHNSWRCVGQHCKGYCKAGTVINPRIRSQNQIVEMNIVCNSCNRITVPLIGAVPSSILHGLRHSSEPD